MSSIGGENGTCVNTCPNQLGEEIENGFSVSSPLIIKSQSGLQYGTISEDNSGNITFTTTTNTGANNNGDIFLTFENTIISGNVLLNGGTSQTLQAPKLATSSPATYNVSPINTTGQSTTTLVPLMLNTSNNQLVIPNAPLIRYFRVSTPDATGNQVDIIDPQGNAYNNPDWVCCIAGFANNSIDRTYNAWTIPYANSTWKVEYDSAGTGNQVWILAIHSSLLISTQY